MSCSGKLSLRRTYGTGPIQRLLDKDVEGGRPESPCLRSCKQWLHTTTVVQLLVTRRAERSIETRGQDMAWTASVNGDSAVVVREAPSSHLPLLNPIERTHHKLQTKARCLRLLGRTFHNNHGPPFRSATSETLTKHG